MGGHQYQRPGSPAGVRGPTQLRRGPLPWQEHATSSPKTRGPLQIPGPLAQNISGHRDVELATAGEGKKPAPIALAQGRGPSRSPRPRPAPKRTPARVVKILTTPQRPNHRSEAESAVGGSRSPQCQLQRLTAKEPAGATKARAAHMRQPGPKKGTGGRCTNPEREQKEAPTGSLSRPPDVVLGGEGRQGGC
ncbi:hypothetical protein NDU88_002630 [Pleurodeles waltl]|uniref:Uncharacterized protein n=1 Tax=Pleurodeles waltl TaxID=8319 RepID=A0AAV7LGA4_PLEWA|nr:hypothetical protein NDU88_002630 [Pleurodeles waltl]